MARSPIEVKGIRRLLDALTDQAVRCVTKSGMLSPHARLELEGEFHLDEDGQFTLGAKTIPLPSVPGTVAVGSRRKVERIGDGRMRIVFEISRLRDVGRPPSQ